jgi:predicted component of type VI protein secretion system
LIQIADFRKNFPVMPKLTLFVPDEEPMKIAFDDQEEVTIGRAADNDIVLTHDSISGNHAKLQLTDGEYYLVDLGSTNGTFFQGAPADNNLLQHGAEIAFGQVPATYETEDGVAADAAEEEPVAAGEEAVADAGADDFADAGGEDFGHGIHAEAAQQALRPAGMNNLSPLGKSKKKDTLGQVVMLVGILAIFAGVATIATALLMSAG